MKNSMFSPKRYALFFAVMIVISLMSCNATPTQQAFQAQNSPTNTTTNTLPPPTETPSPTFTLVPTLTPSPTLIPQQPLAHIISLVYGAASFNPIAETMPYEKQTPGPHHIVLITELGESHEGNDKVPSEWLPKNVSEVELIAIITPEEVVIRNFTKSVNGKRENRSCVRRDIRVKLVEANSGELIEKILFQGSYPKLCEFWDMKLRWVYGEPPSFDEVVQWLQGYVSP